MKKTINKKVYDSGKAKALAHWDNGCFPSDLCGYMETLCITKSGNYFIHGCGGAKSIYAAVIGNTPTSGEKIRPIAYSEAEEWAKRKLAAEEFEALFGKAGVGKSALNVEISNAAKQKLERIKSETEQPLSTLIEKMIANI